MVVGTLGLLCVTTLAGDAGWLATSDGATYEAARFATSSRSAPTARAVPAAPLALTEAADWAYDSAGDGCPPVLTRAAAMRGTAHFRGAIIVHVDAWTVQCSAEQHARAAAQLGAVGWVSFHERYASLMDAQPGFAYGARSIGDVGHHWNVTCADITSSAALPLVESLRAGEALSGRLAPGPGPLEALISSPVASWLALVVILPNLLSVEMALTRLLAFWRVDSGGQLSIPHMILSFSLLGSLLLLLLGAMMLRVPREITWFQMQQMLFAPCSALSSLATAAFCGARA